MALRIGPALVIVSIAGLVFALRAPGLLLQGFVIASFAMLGVFAAILAVRKRDDPNPLDRWPPMLADGLREIRRLATASRPRESRANPYATRPVAAPFWDDEEAAAPVAKLDEHAVARQLTDKLAPRITDIVDELGPLSPSEILTELLREGEDLRSLGRLLRLDLSGYGNRISRGLALARARRFEECALALQVANNRLRAEAQATLEKEFPGVRSDLALRR